MGHSTLTRHLYEETMDINTLVLNHQTNLTALLHESASLKITLDSACFGSVMGPAVKAAGAPASEVANMIADDIGLSTSMEGLESNLMSRIRVGIRRLMDSYATQVAQAASQTVAAHYETNLVTTSMNHAKVIGNQVRALIANAGEISSLAAKLEHRTNNSSISKEIEVQYDAHVSVVTKFAKKMATFDTIIVTTSNEIDSLMEFNQADVDYAEKLKAKQDTRTAVVTEKKYSEQMLMEHFDGGASRNCGGVKVLLKELDVPNNLSKSKGVELIKALTYYLKGRAPWYYTILPQLVRIMAESKIGNHFLPPNKKDGYLGCNLDYRTMYGQQSQELYDYLEIHIPREVMANIRKPFKYGLEELKGQCEIGDGPMAIFCILALYRPSGETYREEIKEKICGLVSKFNDGTNPTAKINENMTTLQEAIDLDIKIPWNRSGKLIVTLLSERSNTFARALTVFTEAGTITDKEDSAVEIKNMFAAIVEACKTLQESGQDVKRVMHVDSKQGKGNQPKGGKAQTGESGDQANPCHFGEKCTRFPCSFGHSKSDNAKKQQNKTSKPTGKGGQGGGKSGKGGKTTKFSGPCQAAKCTAPGKGYRFCTKCHRSGLESGSAIKLKDGSSFTVEVSAKAQQEKRIAQLEKKLTQRNEDGEDSEFEENAEEGKRKRVAFTGIRKRLGKGSVTDRLGLPSMKSTIRAERGPNGTRFNSPESLDEELEIDYFSDDQ